MGLLDLTPPTAPTVPPNFTAQAETFQGSNVIFDAGVTATDGDDPSPTVECNPPSGSLFPIGPTTVTCRATDASGNRSQPSSFRVTVITSSGSYTARGSLTGTAPLAFSAALDCVASNSTRPFIAEWNPGTGTKRFTKTQVTSSICIYVSGYASPAGLNEMSGSAVGNITGPGYQGPGTIEWHFFDGGAGAHAADRARIVIRDDGNNVLNESPLMRPGLYSGTPGGVWTMAP